MKKILYIIIIILLISIMLLSSIALLKNESEDFNQERIFDNLQNTINDTQEQSSTNELCSNKSYYNLFEQNHDMVAWLKIDKTNIDYPIMQNKENPDYYLRRNFYKEYSYYGTPYIEENCDFEKSDNLIIYGHHIKNNKMFGELEKYKDKSFYQSHKIIKFITKNESLAYEILAVFKTDAIKGFKYYNFYNFKSEDSFNEFYKKCIELSFYSCNTSAKFGDKFITLSTCEYSSENGRLAIIAKRL